MILLVDFNARNFLNFEGCLMRGGEIEIRGSSRGSQLSISFMESILEGGTVRIRVPEISGRRAITFNRSMVEGALIDINGRNFVGGEVRFDGVVVNGGLIVFRPTGHVRRGQMKFSGTQFPFDRVALQDGGIRFESIDIEGSVMHFDDLVMKGGDIRFVDVDLKSGSVRMARSAVTGGFIELGDIAGTESGRAIASEVGEFLRPVPSLDVEGAGDPRVP